MRRKKSSLLSAGDAATNALTPRVAAPDPTDLILKSFCPDLVGSAARG